LLARFVTNSRRSADGGIAIAPARRFIVKPSRR
jgi:hypothetical protein